MSAWSFSHIFIDIMFRNITQWIQYICHNFKAIVAMCTTCVEEFVCVQEISLVSIQAGA